MFFKFDESVLETPIEQAEFAQVINSYFNNEGSDEKEVVDLMMKII